MIKPDIRCYHTEKITNCKTLIQFTHGSRLKLSCDVVDLHVVEINLQLVFLQPVYVSSTNLDLIFKWTWRVYCFSGFCFHWRWKYVYYVLDKFKHDKLQLNDTMHAQGQHKYHIHAHFKELLPSYWNLNSEPWVNESLFRVYQWDLLFISLVKVFLLRVSAITLKKSFNVCRVCRMKFQFRSCTKLLYIFDE